MCGGFSFWGVGCLRHVFSLPQVSECPGTPEVSSALAFLSPFTWTSGENYLAVIASKGGESVVDEYPGIVYVFVSFLISVLHSSYIFCIGAHIIVVSCFLIDFLQYHWLVVWLPFFIFPYIGLLIIPIDFHIFQRG